MGAATVLERLRSRWRATGAHGTRGADLHGEIARDIGVSVDMLRQIMSHEDRGTGQELPRLLRAVDLQPGDVRQRHPDVVRDMQAVCSTCAARRRCRRDLARHLSQLTFQTYCPNAPTIAALGRRMGQGAARAR